MAIGPQGPLLKNDGPACRVCGCTEHNACAMLAIVLTGTKRDIARETTIGCSWVKVEPGSKQLCSACMGTAADMAEAFRRQLRIINGEGPPRRRLDKAFAIGQAALLRYRKVKK